MSTPVAFILFNRPDVTARVFESIRATRPEELFLIADGPRPDRPGEADRVAATRQIVAEIDWPCRVHRNYADANLGCANRIATGLTWVFEQTEQAIILEDDCLPHPDFFAYCDELLHRYRDDTRIMHIHGNNHQCGQVHGPYSYFFSKYCHCWGWATWRRAWRYFDLDLTTWPQVSADGWLRYACDTEDEHAYWSKIFETYYTTHTPCTWDFSWTYTCWIQNGLSVYPNVNLVSNIGWGPEATHCKKATSPFANIPVQPILPLSHPPCIIRHRQADEFTFDRVFRPPVRK